MSQTPLVSPDTPPLLVVGTQVGAFRIIALLRSAGSSVNRYIVQTNSQRLVLRECRQDARALPLLQANYELLPKAGIIPATTFSHATNFYAATILPEGTPLRDVWRERGKDIAQQFALMQALCETVHTLNTHELLCLDLSPDTLVVRPDGSIALADAPCLAHLPFTEGSVGADTIALAPEVTANPGDVSQRSDVYAIGAAWLSLLLGEPFSRAHRGEDGLIPPAHLLSPQNVMPAVNRIIARALNPSISRRYKGVLLMRDAIRQAAVDWEADKARLQPANKRPQMAWWSDMGLVRDNNEDSLFASGTNGRTMAIVADGMGGAEGGEVASAIVVKTVSDHLTAQANADPEVALTAAIRAAAQKVYDHARQHTDLRGMGSTVVAAIVRGDRASIGNIGDSRAYLLLREGQIVQLSTDDTQLREMRVTGQRILPEEADDLRGVLARNIGNRPDVAPSIISCPLQSGDMLLLCCDGLTDSLRDDEIVRVVRESAGSDLYATVMSLINTAILANGSDNTTVILYRHP